MILTQFKKSHSTSTLIQAFTEYEDTLIIRTKLNQDISQTSGAEKLRS